MRFDLLANTATTLQPGTGGGVIICSSPGLVSESERMDDASESDEGSTIDRHDVNKNKKKQHQDLDPRRSLLMQRRRVAQNGSTRTISSTVSSRALMQEGESQMIPEINPLSSDPVERSSSRDLMDGIAPTALFHKNVLADDPKPSRRSTALRRGILKQTENDGNDYEKTKKRRLFAQSVSFANIYVRQYARTVGDNPSCSGGPPLSISWEHGDTIVVTVSEYEIQRELNRSDAFGFLMNAATREHLLREVWGFSQSDIAASVRQVLKTKRSRKQTILQSSSPLGKIMSKFAATATATSGNTDNSFDKQAQQSQELRKWAEMQQQQRQKQKQDKRRQLMQPRRVLSSRRLLQIEKDDNSTSDDAEQDPNEDERYLEPGYGILSTPMGFANMKGKINSAHFGTFPLGILSSAHTTNSKSDHKNKVSFAVNEVTHKIWCLTKVYEKVNPSIIDQLWWTEDDMEDRYDQDMEIVALVESQLGKLLRLAYRSTRGCSEDDVDTVHLNFQDLASCSIARGLEGEVVAPVRKLIQASHRSVVLTKQEALRELYRDDANHRSSYHYDEHVMETIRNGAIKFSLPSRLMAQKMAQYDAMAADSVPRYKC